MEISETLTSQWVVSKFMEEHNHDLVTPSKAKRHRSHSSSHRSADIQHLVYRLTEDSLVHLILLGYAILLVVVLRKTARLHIVHTL